MEFNKKKEMMKHFDKIRVWIKFSHLGLLIELNFTETVEISHRKAQRGEMSVQRACISAQWSETRMHQTTS